jgi:F-type H+-transporting ATPase subunit epsilon
VTLQVSLVVPEGEVWAGPAGMVIAKTKDGDIGVLTGHSPVLGIMVEGSLVRILPEDSADGAAEGAAVIAAVNGGFFSVADDRVSVLAREAQIGGDVDTSAVRAALDEALQNLEASAEEDEESSDVLYFRALLRAAGEPADGA